MPIWKREFDLDYLNDICKDTMVSYVGIKFIEKGSDYLKASMPINEHTCQPYGMLHGGASGVLAETVGSIAGNMCCDNENCCLGLELNCSHVKGAFIGDMVTAIAKPINIGATIQVWHISIVNAKDSLICDSKLVLAVRKRKKLAK